MSLQVDQVVERLSEDLKHSRATLLEFNWTNTFEAQIMLEIKAHRLFSFANRLSQWSEVNGTDGIDKQCTARLVVVYLLLKRTDPSGEV